MSSRRDLLRFFGIGTAIVPFVGGSQLAVGKLIAEPKIEIIEPPKPQIIHPFNRSDVIGAEVILKMRDGTTRTREHFDFSSYPIDFLENTKQYFDSGECPTCGTSCHSSLCTERREAKWKANVARWKHERDRRKR